MSRVCLLSLAALLACARAYEDAARKPARIADDENGATVVTGKLGYPLHVPCLESENPTLFVLWYRGHGKGKLLKNDAVYGMRRNALLIRSLTIDTLGPYTCQAYNSEDMKPLQMFVVRVNMSDETSPPDSDWLLPRGMGTLSPGTQPPTSAETSTTTMTTTEAPGLWLTDKSAVTASEGGTVTLRCNSDLLWLHDNPSRKITWKLGELNIDSNADRYRLLSDGALKIVSLYRNDTGVYICVADGVATQEIHLVVNGPVRMPAGIVGDENAVVTGELGKPLQMRCLAYGYPPPSVFWYRGFDEEAIVIYGDMEYETRGNLLTIKSLSKDSLGQYKCGAYNGVGHPASWKVVVRVYKPKGFFENELLVPRDTVAPSLGTQCLTTAEITITTTLRTTESPRLLVTETSTARGITETLEEATEASLVETSARSTTNEGTTDVNGISTLNPCSGFQFGCCADNETEAAGPKGEGCPLSVPVSTYIVSTPFSKLNIGADLHLRCDVGGFPEPKVHWTKDGVTIQVDCRITITGSNIVSRLKVARMSVADSGLYGCHASNQYSSQSDTAQINVQQLVVPAECADNPLFANCNLIVNTNSCRHMYYSKFCCKSCLEAGQPIPSEANLQANGLV